jgi:NitT/TauT family transport system substrate-binding protein
MRVGHSAAAGRGGPPGQGNGQRLGIALAGLLAVGCGSGASPAIPPASSGALPPVAAVEPPARPPALIPLRVAYAAVAAGMAPAWVAQDEGLFREQGLDVELVYLASTRTDQAVVTGDTPIGFGTNTVALRLSGADLVAIAAINSRMAYTVYALPGVSSMAELRGKSMVVTAAGASNTLASFITLRHFGLEPTRDVAIQPSGGTTEQLAMMAQGLADSALFSPPLSLRAAELGMVPLANMAELDIPFLLSAIGTTAAFARDHPEEVRRTLRAYVAAVALMRRDADLTKAVIGKYAQTDDAVALDATYRYYVSQWGRPDFRVQPAAVAAVLRVLDAPGADTAKPEEFIDNRFVDELHTSGFVRQVGAD